VAALDVTFVVPDLAGDGGAHNRNDSFFPGLADPMQGEWVEKGKIETPWDSFSLDATAFSHRGVDYLVWAQNKPSTHGNTNLYIAELENPWTLGSEPVLISRPEYNWEQQRYWVNEGAYVIHRNGRLFMTYSASATDHNYCMGLLVAEEGADVIQTVTAPSCRIKSSNPPTTFIRLSAWFGRTTSGRKPIPPNCSSVA